MTERTYLDIATQALKANRSLGSDIEDACTIAYAIRSAGGKHKDTVAAIVSLGIAPDENEADYLLVGA
jgi:hypothetical protein